MTEAEATTKWCPFSQMQTGHVAIGNRTASGDPMYGATCIGSACMMFRWERPDMVADDPEAYEAAQAQPQHGHCGLAGNP